MFEDPTMLGRFLKVFLHLLHGCDVAFQKCRERAEVAWKADPVSLDTNAGLVVTHLGIYGSPIFHAATLTSESDNLRQLKLRHEWRRMPRLCRTPGDTSSVKGTETGA